MLLVRLEGTRLTSWSKEQIGNVELWVYDPWGEGLSNRFMTLIEGKVSEKVISQLNDFLRDFNKEFGLVVRQSNELWAWVDHLQSINLFYAQAGEYYYITDKPVSLPASVISPLSTQNIVPYLLTSYTLGRRTMSNNIRQVQAGSCIHISDNDLSTFRYFNFWNGSEKSADQTHKTEEFRNILLDVIGEFLESFGDHQLVLMFSGGYDSRLVLWALDRLEANNLLLCSYGRTWQRDVVWSGEFAAHLAYPWVHIPYSFRSFRKLFQSENFSSYYHNIHQFKNKPFFQEYLAIKELENRGILNHDAIIITGNGGDFLSGGHLQHRHFDHPGERQVLIRSIVDKHFVMWEWERLSEKAKNIVEQQISEELEQAPSNSDHLPSLFEWWEWRERQSKLITNSVQQFNWLGYANYMPIWDKRIMRFLKTLPDEQRFNQRFYRNFCEKLSTREGISFSQAQHTVPERQISILRKAKRAAEFYLDPRFGGLTMTAIRRSRKVARDFLGTDTLGIRPRFNAVNSGELVARLIEEYGLQD